MDIHEWFVNICSRLQQQRTRQLTIRIKEDEEQEEEKEEEGLKNELQKRNDWVRSYVGWKKCLFSQENGSAGRPEIGNFFGVA